jgi:hypothetical protein
MPGYTGKTTNTTADVIGTYAQEETASMWGPIPGVTVGAWNGRTVNVQPLYKPVVNGQKLDMPVIYEVPVDQPMTGNGGMTFPIPAGTPVMLTPQMRALDDFEEGGEASAYDARQFHPSTMRASLSGGESLSQNIQNIDLENFHLRFNADGSFGLKGSADGKFQLTGAEGEIFDILASAIEKDAEGFQLLSTEPELVHTGEYASISADLAALAAKVRGMMI